MCLVMCSMAAWSSALPALTLHRRTSAALVSSQPKLRNAQASLTYKHKVTCVMQLWKLNLQHGLTSRRVSGFALQNLDVVSFYHKRAAHAHFTWSSSGQECVTGQKKMLTCQWVTLFDQLYWFYQVTLVQYFPRKGGMYCGVCVCAKTKLHEW